MTHDEILDFLLERKHKMGWTYLEISKRSGVSYQAVHSLFKGQNVQLSTFLRVLKTMGIEYDII